MRFGWAMATMGSAALLAATSCVPAPPPRADVVAAARVADPQTLLRELDLDPAAAAALTKPLAGPSIAAPVAAPSFHLAARTDEDAARARECLTAAVYHEARSESDDGQRAVAQVVLNRVRSRAFPASICGVVYQGSQRRTGCQFSFTCDGSLLRPREPAAWARAARIADAALAGEVYAPVGTATFYHADYVTPWWAPSLARVATVGSHLFYRWRGAMDRALSLRQSYAAVEPTAPRALAAPAAVVESVGVTVHRGNAAEEAPRRMLVSAGVRIHRGALPGETTDPSGAIIGAEDAGTT